MLFFVLFILIALLAPDLAFWRWGHRRLRGRPRAQALFALVMAPLAGQVVWMLVAPDTARRAHHFLPMSWMAAVYLWHLLVLPLAGLALLAAGGVRRAVRRGARPVDETRRSLLRAGVAFFPPVAAGFGGVLSLPGLDRLRLRELEVRLAALPPELDGLRIAHVSDLHYGKYTTPVLLDRVAGTVNDLAADLVLLTGDLIDLSLADLPAALRFVERLDPRSGLFTCEGNHDRIHDGPEFVRRVKASGLPLLRDDSATVALRGARVQLLGVRWARGERARRDATRSLLAQREAGAFPILLAHHPHCFDYADSIPLTLAGHTHGGLLMLGDGIGPGPLLYRYWSGLTVRDGRAVVVSNGVGNWFPVRSHAPAEVIHLTLRRPAGPAPSRAGAAG